MILSILKIIGIVILIILAFIILILGILLFAPIRYQLAGEYKDKLKADILIKWAPLLLKVTAYYHDSKFEYIVRMFGGVVMTNTDIPLSWLGKKLSASSNEVADGDELDGEIGKKNKTSKDSKQFSRESYKDVTIRDVEKESEHLQKQKPEAIESNSKKVKQVLKKRILRKKKKSFWDIVRRKIHALKEKWDRFVQKLRKLNDKREALLKIYHSKRFKVAKQDIIFYIKTLWSVIRPKKLEGYIHFGFENPATTGQALGVMAMFLVWYDRFFAIEPDFEQVCIDGDLNGSGKFRLFSIIKLLIKIILNKNLIKVIKKVQTIIEA